MSETNLSTAEAKEMGASILVVDDNVLNCELFEAMLTPRGYRVEQATSGREALERAERLRPDLVLLDVNMPEMDGFEVARRLRSNESTRLVPVLMVTALGDLDHRLRGLDSGADDYLAKPISQTELVARVQSTLRLSFLRRQIDERQKLELILGDVSDGILILDASGRVREVSPSARRWLALEGDVTSLTEIWGRLEDAPADLEKAVQAGEARDFVLRRDEPPLFLRAGLRPVRDAEGQPSGAVLSLRDVTRETLERKLQQDVLSLVSHKFRTPLTVINSWVQVLVEGGCGEINAQQHEVLTSVAEAGEELRGVLDGMLAYLEWSRRLQRLQRRWISHADLARELQQRVQEQIGPDAAVDIEGHAEGRIFVDPGLFLDALMELVRNGLKFGGQRVQVRASRKEGAHVIEVCDDGPGIPPEHLERIFERFYQIETEFTGQTHGLGLGLSMVKRAMDTMGAQLEVKSQLQQGTCFCVRIEKPHGPATAD